MIVSNSNMQAEDQRRFSLNIAAGNFIELFDFMLYASFAPLMGRLFFPATDGSLSTLMSFSAFASGFLVRPFGGILFGYLGDISGRRHVLLLSVSMMGFSSLAIALLPTYDQLGVLAPVFLVLLRMLQGLSMSGEVCGVFVTLTELAPEKKQARWASMAHVSGISGTLAGSLVAAVIHLTLSEPHLSQLGWRLGFALGGIGCLWLVASRYKTIKLKEHRHPIDNFPLKSLMLKHKMNMLAAGVINMIGSAFYFIVFIYMSTYWSDSLIMERSTALFISSVNTAILILLIPLAAYLSDRYSAIVIFQKALWSGACAIFPCYWLMIYGLVPAAAAGQLFCCFFIAFIYGSGAALAVKVLPENMRMSGMGFSYNVAQMLITSTAPLVAGWLVIFTNNPLAPVFYLFGLCFFSLWVVKQVDNPFFFIGVSKSGT